MKLVEINDVRAGQIRKNFDDLILIEAEKPNGFLYYQTFNEFGGFMNRDVKACYKFLAMPIIGKLGITHRFESGRLVEIKRKEINEDDVVCFDEETSRLAVTLKVSPITITPTLFDGQKTELNRKVSVIGIFGVTHEFINDKEV